MWILPCRQSYEVHVDIGVEGTSAQASNSLDLKNPFFRYSGQPVQSPPGSQSQSPTDMFWSNVSSALALSGGVAHQVTPVLQAAAQNVPVSDPGRVLTYSVNSIMAGTAMTPSAVAHSSIAASQPENQLMMDSSGFLWTNQMTAAAMAAGVPYVGQTHTSLANGSGISVAQPVFAPQFLESKSRRPHQTRHISSQQK